MRNDEAEPAGRGSSAFGGWRGTIPCRRLQVALRVGAIVTLLRPCATSAGFTATPEPPAKVDMAAMKQRLQAAGYAIVVDARIILIVRHAGVESSLYDNGKVLLKTTDRDAAQKAYDELVPHVAASLRGA